MFCLLYLYLDVSTSLYRMINGQSCFHIHLCAHIKSQFNVYIIARLFNITTQKLSWFTGVMQKPWSLQCIYCILRTDFNMSDTDYHSMQSAKTQFSFFFSFFLSFLILLPEPTYHENNILFLGYSPASNQMFNITGIIYFIYIVKCPCGFTFIGKTTCCNLDSKDRTTYECIQA